jgi:hypothetical protein
LRREEEEKGEELVRWMDWLIGWSERGRQVHGRDATESLREKARSGTDIISLSWTIRYWKIFIKGQKLIFFIIWD